MSIYQPYFYIIGWRELDRWYVGAEYAQTTKTANPSNLWTAYFTSSKYVAAFRDEYGDPDVRWTFPRKTAEQVLYDEQRIMREFDVLNDPRWLNKNVGGAILMDAEVRAKISRVHKGKSISLEQRQIISAANKGKVVSAETRRKLSDAFKGRKHTEDAKAKISAAKKGKASYVRTDEHNAKVSASLKGRTFSLEHRKAISEAMRRRGNV